MQRTNGEPSQHFQGFVNIEDFVALSPPSAVSIEGRRPIFYPTLPIPHQNITTHVTEHARRTDWSHSTDAMITDAYLSTPPHSTFGTALSNYLPAANEIAAPSFHQSSTSGWLSAADYPVPLINQMRPPNFSQTPSADRVSIPRQAAVYTASLLNRNTAESTIYACHHPGCGVSCRRLPDLRRHISTQHDANAARYRCRCCGYTNKRKEKVQAHRWKLHH